MAGLSDPKVQLRSIEQARRENWQDELADFWLSVERDVGVERFFTQAREPTFEEGYTDLLTRLVYSADSNFPYWWSKLARNQV